MVYMDASDVAVVAILAQWYNQTDTAVCYFGMIKPTEASWSIYT